jgi:hypothetical protein
MPYLGMVVVMVVVAGNNDPCVEFEKDLVSLVSVGKDCRGRRVEAWRVGSSLS